MATDIAVVCLVDWISQYSALLGCKRLSGATRITVFWPSPEAYILMRLYPAAIDLIDILLTAGPAVWAIFERQIIDGAMWRIGNPEFATAKISRVEAYSRDGGGIWIGIDRTNAHSTEALHAEPIDHKRTKTEERIHSAKPTGKGDADLTARLNLGKQAYLSRTGAPSGQLMTLHHYKFTRAIGESAVGESEESGSLKQRVTEVARGTSWLGIMSFYLTRIPWPLSAKIPMAILLFAKISRDFRAGRPYAYLVYRPSRMDCYPIRDRLPHRK